MRKALLFGLAVLMSGCVSYGHYPAEPQPPAYSCYSTPSTVICYNSFTNRMSYYDRGHYMFNYWYGYSNINRRYIYVRSGNRDRGGVVTPNGYRNSNSRGTRVAVPRSSPRPQVGTVNKTVRRLPKSAPVPTTKKVKAKRRTGGN